MATIPSVHSMTDLSRQSDDTPHAESPRVFISVAEQSADEHAAALIHAFKKDHPNAQFAGLAGPAMQAEGCACFHDMTSRSAMAAAAIKRIPEAFRLLGRLKEYFSRERFDVAVMVDSPALNLPVARIARRANVPVLYYIAPQTWAWGPKWFRNRRVRARVSRIACIWPFEEAYFRQAGIPADFVGHPSFDRLLSVSVTDDDIRRFRGDASPLITILPGSRRHVVHEVFPGQLQVAAALAIRYRGIRFVVGAANDEVKGIVETAISRFGRTLPIRVLTGPENRALAISSAELALVASGTITLEVAYRKTPMLVMYNTNPVTYNLIGRWLIRTPYFSIPNILAGRRIVPEFMPYYRSVDPIIAAAVEWLSTPGKLEKVRHDLEENIRPLVQAGAAERTAAILSDMIKAPASSI